MDNILLKRFLDNNIFLVKDFINYIEEYSLYFDVFPEIFVKCIEEIFSNEKLYSSRNSWKILHFLISVPLTHEQSNRMTKIVINNFYNYTEYMLCDIVCDFISRVNPPEKSLEIFENMANFSKDICHDSALLSGIGIIITHNKNNIQLTKKAVLLFERLIAR